MNYILMIMMFLVASVASAQVPEDAVIKVFTKDGKQIGEMSRKEYKVVKIEDHSAVGSVPSKPEVHPHPKPDNHDDIVALFKARQKKNRVNYILGMVPQTDITKSGSTVKVAHPYKPMVGFLYSRMLNNEASVGFGATSNRNFFLTIGTDFK